MKRDANLEKITGNCLRLKYVKRTVIIPIETVIGFKFNIKMEKNYRGETILPLVSTAELFRLSLFP
jgi:hypothetical protein